MPDMKNINEILDFAIDAEQSASDLYLRIAAKATNPAIRKMLEEFAAEEQGHKAKLLSVKAGNLFLKTGEKPIIDLKISDYIVESETDPEVDYQSVLIFAMQQEKAAFRLYTDLAKQTDNADLKELLLGLAQEEAKHKLRFELEYDENVLTEN